MTIFLDIDGVLNQLQRNYYLDNNCIENLSVLCKKLNAEVVLTSSWRLGYVHFGKCTPQIEELKTKFKKYNIKILGVTSNLGNRVLEINKYISDNNIKDYIILDDDIEEFNGTIISNLYIINNKTGITKKDIKKIVNKYKN